MKHLGTTEIADAGQASAPGSITISDGKTLVQYKRIISTGSDRITTSGTGQIRLTDFGDSGPVIVGTPQSWNTSFLVPDNYVYDVIGRLIMTGTARMTTLGNARVAVTDDFATRSRIVTVGRGY